MSDKRKLSVKFVDDFYNKWVKACLIIDGFETQEEVIRNYDNEGDLKSLADRISGKNGVVFECTYPKGSTDYFEEADNDFVIFPELFEILGANSEALTDKVNE